MKKLLAAILALLIVLGTVSPVNCLISEIRRGVGITELMLNNSVGMNDDLKFRQLTAHMKKGDTLKIVINTPGGRGSVMQDMYYQILDLKQRGVRIETEVTADAMSAGCILFLLGDKRTVHTHSVLMFHKSRMMSPTGIVPTEQLTPGQKKVLDILNYLMFKIVKSVVGEAMAMKLITEEDVYLNGMEALEMGLATHIK